MKLYRSAVHPDQWLAYGKEIGWVVFPAAENGWEQRRSARGIDPIHLREMPLQSAALSGIPLLAAAKPQTHISRHKRAA